MPASLYNLVNRKHHAEAPELKEVATTAQVPETVQKNSADDVPTPTAEETVTEAVAETAVEAVDEVASAPQEIVEIPAVEVSPEPVETPVAPSWDASWSKTQLLGVAQSLNLSVTSINTKSEIISALTEATKA